MIPTAHQARPANAPRYRITLAGQVISPELEARLMRLRLTDRRGLEADQLDITLSDHDGRLALPRHGAELTLALGWQHQGLVERGTFIVDEVEHSGAPDVVVIRARSADMRRELPGKRSQSWHAHTLGEIVTTIARRHDLEPAIGATLRGVILEHIDQTDESDLHFLTRLAEQFDAIATIKAGRLLFMAAGQGSTASDQAIAPITLRRHHGDSHRYVESDRDAFTGVLAYWHDPDAAERAEVIAGSDENVKRLRHTYATRDDAVSAANSEWQRLQRGGAECSLTLAQGCPNLYPETPVRLSGFKAEIDAVAWLVTEAVHELNDSGFSSNVHCEVMT
ncbi:phage late control D family protein [Halomonas urumqiensis]|uniref:Late control protein n=1 Tax=Halomonas urumqiensis TaxID=1684789 RepID=A0A2N7UDI3_9GAMM|nr:phage late control D family protein [Halomonas urumqiensis]PMR78518.1 late control protein [Halomonas urumqiensis]PTB03663.1 phage late control D family protein [Halomonas urumqiensis]GHE20126.1 phage late control protein [Halomonas urumqiensis]